jgi:CheY-like chemotaxis protein
MTAICILVVDDNATNLRLASEVLELDGFEVLRAVDAEQALTSVSTRRPDLVLMDIALPGMDGLDLTRVLKGDPAFASLPIVALSAFAMKGDEQRALAAGCDGYITKPIDTRVFGSQVRAFLAAGSTT